MDTEALAHSEAITTETINDAIRRAHRERSDHIAGLLRGLVRRLRRPRPAPAPGRAVPC